MRCPYCSSDMKPYRRTEYPGAGGARIAEWARCTRCEHATIASLRPVAPRSSPAQPLALFA